MMAPCPPSPPAPQRLLRRLVVLLVCFSLGMHWTLLQGIAWTGMLLSFASQGSVIEAVEKTFDGEHPCPLCLAVQEGQKQDKDDSAPNVAKSMKKWEAVLASQIRLVAPPAQIRSFPWLVSSFEGRSERPSIPPPRV
ncbi:MAG: hypothetical protein JNG86_10730 [Verrucomicrobiaceae bacterium]|nr:hypothetical protein [Verrucomicrobiaceae bacterium]